MKPRKQGSLRRVYLTLAVFAITITGSMTYVLHAGTQMSVNHGPLIDAAMEIKLEATTAHLWLEEALSGDREESLDSVLQHLSSAEWFAQAMLTGGTSREGQFVPLDDPHLREQIRRVQRMLREFRKITMERWNALDSSGAGTDIDQRYDALFGEFVQLTDDVETEIQALVTSQITAFRHAQMALIGLSVALALLAALTFRRHISDRIHAERKLRESEENLSITLDSIGDAVIATDTEGGVTRMNPVAERMTGWTLSEALGQRIENVFRIINEDTRRQVATPVQDVLDKGVIVGLANHTALISKDGREYPIADSAAPIRDAGGKLIGVVLVFRDVSEERKAEKALRQSEERFRLAIMEAPFPIMIHAEGGEIIQINKIWTELTGYEPDDIPTLSEWTELAYGQRKETVRSIIDRVVEGNARAEEGVFCVTTRRGDVLAWDFSTAPLGRLPDGRRLVISMAMDVSEQQAAERKLNESNAMLTHTLERERRTATALEIEREKAQSANRELETANRQLEESIDRANRMAVLAEASNVAKSEFLANMSHEIRTPMTAIKGFAEIVRDEICCCTVCPQHESCETRRKANEYMGTICRNGDHLLSIINDILDLSKIEAGKVTLERIACSPCQIVAEVTSLVRARAEAKGIALDIEYSGAVPESIKTDPTRLRQILINVLGNAVKFTETGEVRLITGFVDDANNPLLQFDVVDTGVGMTRQQAAKVFQAFAQADASTTRKFGGTGLGMTISKRLAEALGGDVIVVETHEGIGTRFRVTVGAGPLGGVKMLEDPMSVTVVANRTGETGGSSDQSDLSGCRVLLAEDGIDNQRLLSLVLKKAGAHVTVVDNGREAVEKVQASVFAKRQTDPHASFDVILMDMQMPVMDGYEATTLLRQKGYTGAIIALTAHTMEGAREKCINAGCDDYAPKPIDRAKLIETVRRFRTAGDHASVRCGAAEQWPRHSEL